MNYLWVALLVAAYMTGWFIYAHVKRRNDVADVAWGMGFVMVAWASMILGSGETSAVAWLVNGLVTLWGVRLAIHIYIRNHNKPEDKRYKQIVPDGGKFRWLAAYLKVFLLQGALLWAISLPIQAVHVGQGGDATIILVWAGTLLWTVGFYFEARGDYELHQFLALPKRAKVLDTGLWRYTRHPNYFGEVVLWWGIFLLGLSVNAPLWTVVGPLTITYLILFVSGVPMLERRYAHDKAYQRYAAKTSKFFPLPSRD